MRLIEHHAWFYRLQAIRTGDDTAERLTTPRCAVISEL